MNGLPDGSECGRMPVMNKDLATLYMNAANESQKIAAACNRAMKSKSSVMTYEQLVRIYKSEDALKAILGVKQSDLCHWRTRGVPKHIRWRAELYRRTGK